MRRVTAEMPRERFVLSASSAETPPDAPRRATPPTSVLTRMVEALQVDADARILILGADSGYTAAVLGRLARHVVVVDTDAAWLAGIDGRLEAEGIANVELHSGDPALGWPSGGPYDGILLTLADCPPSVGLLEQLAIGGRLVLPVGAPAGRHVLHRYTRGEAGALDEEDLGELQYAPLLGDLLVEMGALDRSVAERIATEAAEAGARLGSVLLEHAAVDEVDLYRALARQRSVRFARMGELLPLLDPAVVDSVPRAYLRHNQVVPVAVKDGTVLVATVDPTATVGDLAKATRARRAELILVTPTDYRRLWTAIDLHRGRTEHDRPAGGVVATATTALDEASPPASEGASRPQADLLADAALGFDAHYLALFDALLLDAVAERASDIHLERFADEVRVRLRVDGQLRDLQTFVQTPAELTGLVNVIKVRADLDIAERRLPQGGRDSVRVGGAVYDLRVQTQPALHGEHVVIRLLPQRTQLLSIEDLGFPPDTADAYRRLLDSPSGLVLIVGPTGSGKTTTLYAGLQILAADVSRKVITAEDPIEYALPGIQQTRIRPEIGFAFQHAMRAFVRQDPDVIFVGEIRDTETALEAIRASQTGHVVLSTLHCNDSVDAVQRLLDLGMDPNSIASELLAVVAQRLVRRICGGCRAPAPADPEILAELYPAGAPEAFTAFAGAGCPRCGGSGTHGRVAVIEHLAAGPEIRRGIAHRLSVDDLRAVALTSGLVPMRDNAIGLVHEGLTALSELPRILPVERMAPEREASP